MALYLEGRYLKHSDCKFLDKVEDDIRDFIKNTRKDCVLVFPPVNSHFRHLTHKYVDNYYNPFLCSFSLGEDGARRVIIGSSFRIFRVSIPYSCIHKKLFSFNKELKKISDCICPQRLCLLQAQDPEFARFVASYEDIKKATDHKFSSLKMPRMKENGVTTVRDRHKRPDKQLYVPRALRKTNSEVISEKNEKGSKISEDKAKISKVLNQTSCKSIGNNSMPQKLECCNKKVLKVSNSTLTDISTKVEQSTLLTHQTCITIQTKHQSDVSSEINVPVKLHSLELSFPNQTKKDSSCADVEKDDIPVITMGKDIAKFSDEKYSGDLINKVKSEYELMSEESFQNSSEDLTDKVKSESEFMNEESFQNSSKDLIDKAKSESEFMNEESFQNSSEDLTDKVKSESELMNEESFQNSSKDLIDKAKSESELMNEESFQNSSEDLTDKVKLESELMNEESFQNSSEDLTDKVKLESELMNEESFQSSSEDLTDKVKLESELMNEESFQNSSEELTDKAKSESELMNQESSQNSSEDVTDKVKSESELINEELQDSSENLSGKVKSKSELLNGESFQNSSENLTGKTTSESEVLNEESIDASHVKDNVVKTTVSPENDEESWEAMFNDDGDCLDPKFVKELCNITGRIDLTAAKSDYSEYQPQSRYSPEEFENIVELYGFPVEFKTQDLTSAFSTFQEASYNIKWVDDCHALAIFSSPVIASQALHLTHPFIKVRPLSEGIKESKEKARLCSRMLEVRKPRPATSAVLARRLVSGALGLKTNISKEQRELERNKLREAKEKKRLKAKQRQDIWNGIVS